MPNPDSTRNTPLPPSVEKAYWRKCIDLKKRINEIEESNDAGRVRVLRLERAIRKMRVERAMLLERLVKTQNLALEESDRESSPEILPRERMPRPRRSAGGLNHRSSADEHRGSPATTGLEHQAISRPQNPVGPSPSSLYGKPVLAPAVPTTPLAALRADYPTPEASMEHIHQLPVGTSVILTAEGIPKGPPWLLTDLDPRHHYQRNFDSLPVAEQIAYIRDGYRPIDERGQAIPIYQEQSGEGRFMHAKHGVSEVPIGFVPIDLDAAVRTGLAPAPPRELLSASRHPPPDRYQHELDMDRDRVAVPRPSESSGFDSHPDSARRDEPTENGGYGAMNH